MTNFRWDQLTPLLCLMPFLSGCAAVSTAATVARVANVAMQVAGLKQPTNPELPDAQKPPRRIDLRLHAGENLNAGTSNQALAVVIRLYTLKQPNGFEQASYESFLIPQREKETFGADLVGLREITLLPGQRYEVVENLTREANYLGVVALFRSPAPTRWKTVFAASDAEKSGITIGVHACALTIGAGSPVTESDNTKKLLALAKCE